MRGAPRRNRRWHSHESSTLAAILDMHQSAPHGDLLAHAQLGRVQDGGSMKGTRCAFISVCLFCLLSCKPGAAPLSTFTDEQLEKALTERLHAQTTRPNILRQMLTTSNASGASPAPSSAPASVHSPAAAQSLRSLEPLPPLPQAGGDSNARAMPKPPSPVTKPQTSLGMKLLHTIWLLSVILSGLIVLSWTWHHLDKWRRSRPRKAEHK